MRFLPVAEVSRFTREHFIWATRHSYWSVRNVQAGSWDLDLDMIPSTGISRGPFSARGRCTREFLLQQSADYRSPRSGRCTLQYYTDNFARYKHDDKCDRDCIRRIFQSLHLSNSRPVYPPSSSLQCITLSYNVWIRLILKLWFKIICVYSDVILFLFDIFSIEDWEWTFSSVLRWYFFDLLPIYTKWQLWFWIYNPTLMISQRVLMYNWSNCSYCSVLFRWQCWYV